MRAFVCNSMLGKLCKFMRMCGLDTTYSANHAVILVQARKENRIIITRATKFKNIDNVCYLEQSDPLEQLGVVIARYDLKQNISLLSRCLECNALLRKIEKSTIADRVPYFTFKNFKEFSECPNCRKIFWKGSHYERMIIDINAVLQKTDSEKGRA